LDAVALARGSYCDDWTLAEVLSHLGSQAEIFARFLESGLEGGAPPSQEEFPAIWDAWNRRTSRVQARDSAEANERLIARLEGLDDERLATLRVQMFGMNLDAVGLLGIRLSEHAIHAWDVAVALDPTTLVAPDAVTLLVDRLPEMAAGVGRSQSSSSEVDIRTTGPERAFRLVTGGVRLEPLTESTDAGGRPTMRLPSEALLRLVYGRLASTAPSLDSISTCGVELDDLRTIFPGF
jgi:uncharacterized protein (TIGR03083 family)